MEDYISDNTVSKQSQDEFQRYDFAKRIANTISNRSSTENIVFGLYGKWGSGKSSMLKFIEKELDEEKIIQVHFNPWRYKDEDGLLIEFFQTLAKQLDKNIYSPKNRIFKFSKKLLSATGELSKLVYVDTSVIGNMLPQGNIIKFKKRTEEFLKLSDKKLVIFIDDIDRLDKDELFTLFRLVKLTADFSNTVYILSFDKEMVAKAIGQRFGKGDHIDGSNFLEKIIQIPIELPDFRYDELRNYTIDLIEKVLNKNSVALSESEINRFISAFENCLFKAIITPRNAKQYYNALEFSVPLMKGEVNMVDFIIFEGLKLFYPKYVEFVKINPAIFITGFIVNNSLITDINEKDKSKTTHSDVEILLRSLFPKFKQVFENISLRQPKDNEQSISSADYFDRYLSYSLAKKDISDVEFTEFIQNLSAYSNTEVTRRALKFIENGSVALLLYKIESLGGVLGQEETNKIITFIFNHSELLKDNEKDIISLTSNARQVAIFTTKQFKILDNFNENHSFLLVQIKSIKNISFLLDFLKYSVYGYLNKEEIASELQVKEIYKISIETILKSLEVDEFVFDKYPKQTFKIFFIWENFDCEKAGKHIKGYLNSPQGDVKVVLKSFVGLIHVNSSNGSQNSYLNDLKIETFEQFKKLNCEKLIYDAIHKVYSIDELEAEELVLNSDMNDNSEINLANQFLHYYNESLKPIP